MITKAKETIRKGFATLTCHRAFYSALCLCHANGCWMTDYPALYAPMAIVYAGLAIRG